MREERLSVHWILQPEKERKLSLKWRGLKICHWTWSSLLKPWTTHANWSFPMLCRYLSS
jgi:hypothetical protein